MAEQASAILADLRLDDLNQLVEFDLTNLLSLTQPTTYSAGIFLWLLRADPPRPAGAMLPLQPATYGSGGSLAAGLDD